MAKNKALDDSALSKAAGGAHLEAPDEKAKYVSLVSDVGKHEEFGKVFAADVESGMAQDINEAMGGGKLSNAVISGQKVKGMDVFKKPEK